MVGSEQRVTEDHPLSEIVGQYGPAIWRIARTYADDDADRDDLHQEILFQLWRSLPSYRGRAALGTWVYRVALNTALTHRRQSVRRARLEVPVDPDQEVAGPVFGDADRDAALLHTFLAGLGPIDRSVLVLYMEGLSHQEIGDVVGVSAGAAGVRLHRIKQVFAARYVEG
jgi:RNA polymerase sigma-70 factor, ECF subfamily